MALENITGNLLAYKQLEPETFQHVDQITTERRTNQELRNQWFYTADGELYTIERKKHLWVITRGHQNLVLTNIDEAYRQLTNQGNYFPDTEAARDSVTHSDSVTVNLEGLKLVKDSDEYGHFVVDPKNVKKLNSEQRRAAQRIYGSDEENFGLNMEMFAKAEKTPHVFVLMPEYVQSALNNNGKKFFARASWLGSFGLSNFGAGDRNVGNDDGCLRGVRRKKISTENEGKKPIEAQKMDVVPQIVGPTLEQLLEYSRPFVPEYARPEFEKGLIPFYQAKR